MENIYFGYSNSYEFCRSLRLHSLGGGGGDGGGGGGRGRRLGGVLSTPCL